DSRSSADAGLDGHWNVVARPPAGPAYRDFTLLFQDGDDAIGTHRMPYTTRVAGALGINYQLAPPGKGGFAPELAIAPGGGGKPELPKTPVLEAFAGESVRVHVVGASSEQNQVFSIEGHEWPAVSGLDGSTRLSSIQFGGLEAVTLDLPAGGDAG